MAAGSKYRNRKVEYGGIIFDSKKEFNRYKELKRMEQAGLISNLRRQVKYILIPEQRAESPGVFSKGPHKGQEKPGKLLEKECAYIADFVYYDPQVQADVVEDTKGFRTKEYRIKRKLMLQVHGICIREI